MKTRIAWLAGLLMLNIISISAQDLFEKLGESEHISTVYISKAMMKMFANASASQGNIHGVDIQKISSKLDQLDIYTSENEQGMTLIRKEAKQLASNTKEYVTLMRIRDDGNNVIFYGIPDATENGYKAMVMFVDEKDECVLIRLLGYFSAEDIQSITKQVQ